MKVLKDYQILKIKLKTGEKLFNIYHIMYFTQIHMCLNDLLIKYENDVTVSVVETISEILSKLRGN